MEQIKVCKCEMCLRESTKDIIVNDVKFMYLKCLKCGGVAVVAEQFEKAWKVASKEDKRVLKEKYGLDEGMLK
jgi:ferredoxin-like protein FixX